MLSVAGHGRKDRHQQKLDGKQDRPATRHLLSPPGQH